MEVPTAICSVASSSDIDRIAEVRGAVIGLIYLAGPDPGTRRRVPIICIATQALVAIFGVSGHLPWLLDFVIADEVNGQGALPDTVGHSGGRRPDLAASR